MLRMLPSTANAFGLAMKPVEVETNSHLFVAFRTLCPQSCKIVLENAKGHYSKVVQVKIESKEFGSWEF